MKKPTDVIAIHQYNDMYMACDCKIYMDRPEHAKHVIEELHNEGYDIVEKLDAVWLGQIKFVLSMYKNNPDKELKQSLDGLAAELFVVMAETLGID